MTRHNSALIAAPVSPAADRCPEPPAAPTYCRPRLVVAGSAVDLVQGTYGPFNDISGYYTYSDGLI